MNKEQQRPSWAKHDAGVVCGGGPIMIIDDEVDPFPGSHEWGIDEGCVPRGFFAEDIHLWCNVVCEKCQHTPCPMCTETGEVEGWCDVLGEPEDDDVCCEGSCTYSEPVRFWVELDSPSGKPEQEQPWYRPTGPA